MEQRHQVHIDLFVRPSVSLMNKNIKKTHSVKIYWCVYVSVIKLLVLYSYEKFSNNKSTFFSTQEWIFFSKGSFDSFRLNNLDCVFD